MAWDDGLREVLRAAGPGGVYQNEPIELLPNGVRIGSMMWTYPLDPLYRGLTLSPYGGLSMPIIMLLTPEQYTQGALDYLYRLAGRPAPSPLVLDQIVLANIQANTPKGIVAAAGGVGGSPAPSPRPSLTPLPQPGAPVVIPSIGEGPLVMMQIGPPVYDLTKAANMSAAQVAALVKALGVQMAAGQTGQQATQVVPIAAGAGAASGTVFISYSSMMTAGVVGLIVYIYGGLYLWYRRGGLDDVFGE